MRPPAPEAAIRRAEDRLGRTLPAPYRAFLASSNGGSLEIHDEEWRFFPVFDESDRKMAARTAEDVVRETAAAQDWDGFPSDAVAVAANEFGDYLVVTGQSDAPMVWNHEDRSLDLAAFGFDELVQLNNREHG